MSAAPLLWVDRLSQRFPGHANAAVEDVSVTIAAGETLGLVGESGSGKPLTALSIMGLAPESAKAAAAPGIYWHGEKLDAGLLARIRGRRIGMVFQEPAGCLNPLMTVGRQVAAVAGRGTLWPRCSLRWSCTHHWRTAIRMSCPAGSSNEPCWQSRSRAILNCSLPTNPQRRWMLPSRCRSWRCCSGSRRSVAWRFMRY